MLINTNVINEVETACRDAPFRRQARSIRSKVEVEVKVKDRSSSYFFSLSLSLNLPISRRAFSVSC